MTKPIPWGALLLLLPAGVVPLILTGQRSVESGPRSRFQDWTTHYVVYPHSGTMAALEAVGKDPRARFRWQEIEERQQSRNLMQFLPGRVRMPRRPAPVHEASRSHPDWSISLGTATTAASMFPAKFNYDPTFTPSCVNDFIVFPVNVAGSATQPNLVGLNNLYSGTAGSTGICNRTSPTNDDGVSATVLWSYDINGVGGAVTTSPVISYDASGSKIAFVESAAGKAAHFHVLAWKSGDGKTTNAQNALVPKVITTFSATAPAAGSGGVTDLALGAAATGTDTLSSPFVDYFRDTAYVGNDIGVLYRIMNVFCTLSTCLNALPTLDGSWGTGGAVTTGCGAKLTGAVVDFVTLNVFVGCSNGKVYGFTSAGVALATASIAVGDGSATGGIVDPPIVDGANGFIYAVAGTGAGTHNGNAVLVQATTALGGLVFATVGTAGLHPLHAPSFNDPYFSNATSTTWLIYVASFAGGGPNLELYAATFSNARVLTAGTPGNALNIGTRVGEYAPLTEFLNTGTGTDWLFIPLLIAPSNLGESNINTFAGAAPTVPATGIIPATSTGLTGVVVDNISGSAQASSIYFGSMGSNTAIKLTQTGLQ